MARLSEEQKDNIETAKFAKTKYISICDLRILLAKPYNSMPEDMTLQQYARRKTLIEFKISELKSSLAYMGHMMDIQDIKYVSNDFLLV